MAAACTGRAGKGGHGLVHGMHRRQQLETSLASCPAPRCALWRRLPARASPPRPRAPFYLLPLQPKNYLDFISTYRRLLAAQRKGNEDMTMRLSGGRRAGRGGRGATLRCSHAVGWQVPAQAPAHHTPCVACHVCPISVQACSTPHRAGGLSKLEQAATEVDALQKELTQARVVVQAATEECNQLLTVRPWGRGGRLLLPCWRRSA